MIIDYNRERCHSQDQMYGTKDYQIIEATEHTKKDILISTDMLEDFALLKNFVQCIEYVKEFES